MPIDWSNPITRDLKVFVTFNDRKQAWDHAGNRPAEPQSSAYLGTTPTVKGMASEHPITTANAGVQVVAGSASAIEAFTGLGSTGCTFMTLARNSDSVTLPNQNFLAAVTSAPNRPFNHRILADAGPRFTIYQDGGTIVNSESPYPTGKTLNDWCFHGGTLGDDGTTVTCRIDRVKDASPGTVTGTIDDPTAGDCDFTIGADGSSSSSWSGEIMFSAWWKRELSDVEWNSMVENPWQVLFGGPLALAPLEQDPVSVSITDVANSGETPGSGTETWDDGSTGNVITGTGFL